MAIKIGIVNQKGGVGKTTTAICLSDAMSQIGYKTLLVDFDPQANSSKVFLANDKEKTIYDGILKKEPIDNIIVKGNDMGDIIPSDNNLKKALEELVTAKAGENKLKKCLSEVDDKYDVIIIDSAPSPGIMMDNVLTASDGVIIPMEAETFAIDGLASLLNNIYEVQEDLNPELRIYGVLMTKLDKTKSVQNTISQQFEKLEESGVHTFKTVIRNSAAIPKIQGFMNISNPSTASEKKVADSNGSIYKYGTNNGAVDYSNFAKELMEVIANG